MKFQEKWCIPLPNLGRVKLVPGAVNVPISPFNLCNGELVFDINLVVPLCLMRIAFEYGGAWQGASQECLLAVAKEMVTELGVEGLWEKSKVLVTQTMGQSAFSLLSTRVLEQKREAGVVYWCPTQKLLDSQRAVPLSPDLRGEGNQGDPGMN